MKKLFLATVALAYFNIASSFKKIISAIVSASMLLTNVAVAFPFNVNDRHTEATHKVTILSDPSAATSSSEIAHRLDLSVAADHYEDIVGLGRIGVNANGSIVLGQDFVGAPSSIIQFTTDRDVFIYDLQCAGLFVTAPNIFIGSHDTNIGEFRAKLTNQATGIVSILSGADFSTNWMSICGTFRNRGTINLLGESHFFLNQRKLINEGRIRGENYAIHNVLSCLNDKRGSFKGTQIALQVGSFINEGEIGENSSVLDLEIRGFLVNRSLIFGARGDFSLLPSKVFRNDGFLRIGQANFTFGQNALYANSGIMTGTFTGLEGREYVAPEHPTPADLAKHPSQWDRKNGQDVGQALKLASAQIPDKISSLRPNPVRIEAGQIIHEVVPEVHTRSYDRSFSVSLGDVFAVEGAIVTLSKK
ncbi:MAG: hypothetical protein LBQ08_04225 [Holosporaceae bacterium]|nr:hypothetical protein [Holosporaceae bacterium]